jgi:hypothetical protein
MTEYELSRRDAIAALTAAGIGVSSGGLLAWDSLTRDGESDSQTGRFTETDREALDALAETLFPTAVSGIPEFVETYVVGRLDAHPDREAKMVAAIDVMDSYTREWFDEPFRALDADDRSEALDMMGVDVTDPDPEGTDVERVRFYLVNELLFALYSSPTGGELLGLENPQGYPGGTASYQQGPN